MKINKDLVIFELVGKTRSNYLDSKTRQEARGLGSFGLKHTQTILYTETEGKHKGESYERQIRYMPDQRSVFVDEQNENLPDPSAANIDRFVSKPKFVNGLLMVKRNQKNLLNFLRTHPENEENQELRVNSKQKSVFRERNAEKIAAANNAKTMKVIKAEGLVFTADFQSKILPIARYLKIDVDQPASLVIHDVKIYAAGNPEEFLALMDSEKVQRVYRIEEAVSQGVLNITGQRILWSDGRQIVDVPVNLDPVHYLSEISFDNRYRSVYAEIERLTTVEEPTQEQDTNTIVENESTDTSALENLSTEDIFETLKAKKIITWVPPFWMLGKDKLGQGKEPSLLAIAENKSVYIAKLIE